MGWGRDAGVVGCAGVGGADGCGGVRGGLVLDRLVPPMSPKKPKPTRDSDAKKLDKISREPDPQKRASLLKKLLGG